MALLSLLTEMQKCTALTHFCHIHYWKMKSDIEFIFCLWTIVQHSWLKQCEINFWHSIEKKSPWKMKQKCFIFSENPGGTAVHEADVKVEFFTALQPLHYKRPLNQTCIQQLWETHFPVHLDFIGLFGSQDIQSKQPSTVFSHVDSLSDQGKSRKGNHFWWGDSWDPWQNLDPFDFS